MGLIGCLGQIPFVVSDSLIQSLENGVWSGSARYAIHQRHAHHALTEFTGLDPDTFTFDMILLSELGVDPMSLIWKLWDYERGAIAVPLVIGGHAYGKYRWTIQRHTTSLKATDRNGDLVYAVVSVELLEYLRADKP